MWPFRQARHFYTGRRRNQRVLIVVHDMEAPDGPTTAENVAGYFAGPNAPQASAHFCCDQNSVVQCVKVGDTAWAAPNANADGIHIEHAGYARQSQAQWLEDDAVLKISSCVAAELVHTLKLFPGIDIPLRRLTVAEIAAGRTSGFAGHLDITRAYRTAGGHTDPGDGFPWEHWFTYVRWWVAQMQANPNYKADFV